MRNNNLLALIAPVALAVSAIIGAGIATYNIQHSAPTTFLNCEWYEAHPHDPIPSNTYPNVCVTDAGTLSYSD